MSISLVKQIEQEAPKLLSLAKSLDTVLERKNMKGIIAAMVEVHDASGSMRSQYEQGDVQLCVNKLVPVAIQFDDDGKMDSWAFADRAMQLSPLTLKNYETYINTDNGGWRNWMTKLDSSYNNEPVVIKEIIKKYKGSKRPVFVIFQSDGGVAKDDEIKSLLKDARKYPIFWQFVGIGGRNYGVLQQYADLNKTDTEIGTNEKQGFFAKLFSKKQEGNQSGEAPIKNCGFFSMETINSLSDDVLYDKLLEGFSNWLVEAKERNIIK